MFHKIRHKDPTTYVNAIRSQNSFLADSHVIPILGVSVTLKFYLEADIMKIAGVTNMTKHKNTNTTGSWNIMTTHKYFSSVVKTLESPLLNWVKFYIKENTIDNSPFENPSISFKNWYQEEESTGSFGSYLSACTSLYSINNKLNNDPPTDTNPAPQVWGTPPSIATTSATPSTITQDEFTKVLEENKQMAQQIKALQQQVLSLLKQDTKSQSTTSPPQPAPDLQKLIITIMQQVIHQLKSTTPAHQLQEAGPSNKQVQTHSNEAEMSFNHSIDQEL